MHHRLHKTPGTVRLALAIIAPVFGLTCAVCSADNSVNSLESPPPLTTEDLSRRVNAPADAASPATEENSSDSSPGAADVVTEYRIQQKLYLIEVKPRLGGNYFLKDNDGDGSLDEYRQNAERDTNIGKWRLGSW